jgi:hypothetical protein
VSDEYLPRASLGPVGFERSAQTGYVPVHQCRRARRWLLTPEAVDDLVERDDAVHVDQEDGEQRSLAWGAERHRVSVRPQDLELTQDAELHPATLDQSRASALSRDGCAESNHGEGIWSRVEGS